MAFDQSSNPKDLRPVNISRINTEEARISSSGSGRTPEGFYANPPRTDASSSPSAPVYFTVAAPDAGFVSLGLANPSPHIGRGPIPGQAPVLPMWGAHVPAPFLHQGASPIPPGISPSEYMINPNFGATRVGSSGADQASDDGGEDSVSRKKVKFLCSFGGRILPRPSDGMLRYVGGQTRIISVRKDVSFTELVQKMMDMFGQPVVIKYQLPDEDLDALVSVSCPDDLENMMEEYEKLLERSSDRSSKLRLFLFSASGIDFYGMTQFENLNNSGQKYVDAVNGVMEGVGGGITRKESIASVTSTQNSDLSGTEAVDSLLPNQEVSGPLSASILSPGSDSTITNENFLRLSSLDVSPTVPTSESSTVPLVAPLVPRPPPVVPSLSETSLERTVPLPLQQQPLMEYDLPPQQSTGKFPPPPSPYLQGFVDPHKEAVNGTTTEYQRLPSQVIYGNHPVVTTARPVMVQPQYHETIPGIGPQQFIPKVHMTMAPTSTHLSVNPSMLQQMMQSQRVVAVPADQSYGTFQAQVPPGVVPGFNWHQIPAQEHVAFSESWVPHNQQQVLIPENIPRMDDCNMCQKQLPHAHSDSVVPDQSQGNAPNTTVVDVNSLYRSLHLEDVARTLPINQAVVTTQAEVDGLAQSNPEAQLESDRIASKRINETDKTEMLASQGVTGVTGGAQTPYGVVMGKVGHSQSEDSVQHMVPQVSHVRPDILVSKCVAGYNAVAGVPFVATELMSHETTKDYPGHGVASMEDTIGSNISNEFTRPVDGMTEQIQVSQPEILYGGEQSKSSPVDQSRKDDIFEQRSPIMLPNTTYTKPALVPGANSNQPVASCTDLEPVVATNNASSPVSPSNWTGNIQESANSLFSNQDPFYFRRESHFPPPKPSKITVKREVPGPGDPHFECRPANNGEQNLQVHVVDPFSLPSGNLTKDYGSDLTLPTKGSSEDLIKQELQATAEGVAASVLQSSGNSNVRNTPASDASYERGTENNSDSLRQSKLEGINLKSEKASLGFPLTDGLGRLQIIRNSDLEELRELGSGTFGTVYHGKWRGTDVAIKRINDRCFAGKPSEQERMREDFWNEAIKLADLHHPNVVAFYGVVLDGPGGSVATVTEYMVNGSLRTALQKNERTLDNRKRLLIAMDVAFGMEYLHSRNIVHFDLKSDNLLVNLRDPHRPICKVGDLGLSKVKCQTLISGGVRGTLPWMAPELLNGTSSLVSEKVDVFSYGIVMWELITGEEPYADLHYGAIIGGIVSNTLRPPVPDNCNPDWKSLMERCWSAEPSERPSFTEIANELRSMATKLPPKAQNQALNPRTTNVQGV